MLYSTITDTSGVNVAKLAMLREELMRFALNTKQQVTVDELLYVFFDTTILLYFDNSLP